MGHQDVVDRTDPKQRRLFTKALLNDLRALEHMLSEGCLETGVRRIGAEQELVLVDAAWRPAPVAMELLDALSDETFTTELARFNLEFNVPPLMFGGDCLRQLEHSMQSRVERAQELANVAGIKVLLTGTLPTIRQTDLGLDNLTPLPRYRALNDALRQLRGTAFELRFSGTDEIVVQHDSVMLEACNTSCQFHFQVGPEEFAALYNIAQAVAAPVLAAATNSPLLFGRRLWRETRIALFEQAVDTRPTTAQLSDRRGRVRFGNGWLRDSVSEIFREDIARFRSVLAMKIDEEPFSVLASGKAPKLQALQLHNGTVYRWMRPCYGICEGKAHLRIENRVLPSGPTVVDEIANAALWFGLISGLCEEHGDITRKLDFDDAKTNFIAAAKFGLDTRLMWIGGQRVAASELICKQLLPIARNGLAAAKVDSGDIDRYLGIIEERVAAGRTGSQWLVDSLNGLDGRGTRTERLCAVTAATYNRQRNNAPVHTWSLANMSEAGAWQKSYLRVEQYMTTDVFSVHEDEVIDLVASVMDWERVRHVPVEDDNQRLIGLISYRQLLRFLAHDLPHGKGDPVSAKVIMQADPITVTPDTPTLEAIAVMRHAHVACLPVVDDQRLVGIVTEADFMNIAAQMLEDQLREDAP